MKYKVGDKLVFFGYGTFMECNVVSVLDKTTRYRVEYPSSNGNKCVEMRKESELFINISDCLDYKINEKRYRIEILQKEIQILEQKRITAVSEAK